MMFRDRRSLWSEKRITPPRLRTYPNKSLWPRNYSSVPFGTELYHFLRAIYPDEFRKVGYPADWDRWSSWVKRRAGYRCQKCGVSGDRVKLETHHIIPVSEGGSTSVGNLICLCERCHSMLHPRMLTRYIREHPWEFGLRSFQPRTR